MELKKCSKCGEDKPKEEFHKHSSSRDGRAWACKVCRKVWRQENEEILAKKDKAKYQKNKEAILKKRKIYRQENRELISKRAKAHYQQNRELISKRAKAHYQQNKEAILKQHKVYNRENRDAITKQKTERLRNNPTVRLLHNMRCSMNRYLKGKSKTSPTLGYVGKNNEDLMSYLEMQFTEGMSRENYGKWHVDHIRPLSSFEFDKHKVGSAEFEALLGEAWHYTNLQPLWAADNISKGARWGPVEKD